MPGSRSPRIVDIREKWLMPLENPSSLMESSRGEERRPVGPPGGAGSGHLGSLERSPKPLMILADLSQKKGIPGEF